MIYYQFTMKRSTTNLPFFDTTIQKFGWIYTTRPLLQEDMPFTSNQLQSCLINIPFCLARRIFTIFEAENTKLKWLSELKTLKQQKYPIPFIENSIQQTTET